MVQHLAADRMYLGLVFRPVEQIDQRAITRPRSPALSNHSISSPFIMAKPPVTYVVGLKVST
jgi:hypothetical protein